MMSLDINENALAEPKQPANNFATAWNLPAPRAQDSLRYTNHAMDRVLSRRLPIVKTLPSKVRLADRDSSASIYKVLSGDDTEYFLVVTEEN